MSELRVPVTMRLTPEDKALFTSASAVAGLEAGIASRQIVELVTRYMRSTGADYIETLAVLNAALKPKVRVQAGRAP